MEARFLKFRESLQPAVKLAIAAEDCFRRETPEKYRREYEVYLRQRLRPAAALYAENQDTESLDSLWNLEPFPRSLVEDLLQQGLEQKKNGVYAWALRRKKENWGFMPRNFSL